jgi:hypothetical protein
VPRPSVGKCGRDRLHVQSHDQANSNKRVAVTWSCPSSLWELGSSQQWLSFSRTCKKSTARELCLPTALILILCSAYSSALGREVTRSSETSVDFQRTALIYIRLVLWTGQLGHQLLLQCIAEARTQPSCMDSSAPSGHSPCLQREKGWGTWYWLSQMYSHMQRSVSVPRYPDYSEWQDEKWMMNCTGFIRKRQWHNRGTVRETAWKECEKSRHTCQMVTRAGFERSISTEQNSPTQPTYSPGVCWDMGHFCLWSDTAAVLGATFTAPLHVLWLSQLTADSVLVCLHRNEL